MKKLMLIITVFAVALLGVGTLSPERAEAYRQVGASGNPGIAHVVDMDGSSNTGAYCQTYDSYNNRVWTAGPYVWAHPNYTKGQYVTSRIVIYKNDPYTDGTNFYYHGRSDWKPYKLAYPNSPAKLHGTNLYVKRTNYRLNYKTHVQVRWYDYSGYVSGTKTLQIDYYYHASNGQVVGDNGNCVFAG